MFERKWLSQDLQDKITSVTSSDVKSSQEIYATYDLACAVIDAAANQNIEILTWEPAVNFPDGRKDPISWSHEGYSYLSDKKIIAAKAKGDILAARDKLMSQPPLKSAANGETLFFCLFFNED